MQSNSKDWIFDEYQQIINLPHGIELSKKYNYPTLFDKRTHYSGWFSHDTLYDIRYHIIPSKNEFTCTVFKLQYKTHDMVYGILYSRKEFEYACVQHTYNSMDGEFRRNFIRYNQIDYIYEKYPELVDIIEQYYIKKLEAGKFIVHYECFGCTDVNKMHSEIDNSRVTIKFLVAHWICSASQYYEISPPSHIGVGYMEAMVEPTRDLFKLVNGKELELARKYLMRLYVVDVPKNDKVISSYRIGQKFTMPSLVESQNPMDISYGVWREIYVAKKVSNLTINGITTGVPIFIDWFVISGLSPALFDNSVSYQKIINSRRGEMISETLSDARGYTFKTNDQLKLEEYYGPYMEQLSQTIQSTQTAAEEHVILGDVVLCSLSEDVGFTWGNLLQNVIQYGAILSIGDILSDSWTFARYLFDIIYTLYNMNMQCGVLQGDLHFNNATFHIRVLYTNVAGKNTYPNSRIAYEVNDKLYMFPHYGRYACVIDFSRALLDSKRIAEDAELDENIKHKALADQIHRAMGMIYRWRPDFYTKNHAYLVSAVERDFTGVWQVLRCVDMLNFSTNLLQVFTDLSANAHMQTKLGANCNITVVRKEFIPLLQSIIKLCDNYFDNGLRQLVDAVSNVRLENVNLTIIQHIFAQYELPHVYDRRTPQDIRSDTTTSGSTIPSVMDYWSASNTIRYSAYDYDNFPPLIKLSMLKKHGYIVQDPIILSGEKRYVAEQAAAPAAISKFKKSAEKRSADLREVDRTPEHDKDYASEYGILTDVDEVVYEDGSNIL